MIRTRVTHCARTRPCGIYNTHVWYGMVWRVHRHPCARQMSERRDAASRRSPLSPTQCGRGAARVSEKERETEREEEERAECGEPFSRSHEAAPCATTTTTTRTTRTSGTIRARYISSRRRSSRFRRKRPYERIDYPESKLNLDRLKQINFLVISSTSLVSRECGVLRNGWY